MSEMCSELSSKMRSDPVAVPDYITEHVQRCQEFRDARRAEEARVLARGGLLPLDRSAGGPGGDPIGYGWMSRRGD